VGVWGVTRLKQKKPIQDQVASVDSDSRSNYSMSCLFAI
jgi:hypothetical protein